MRIAVPPGYSNPARDASTAECVHGSSGQWCKKGVDWKAARTPTAGVAMNGYASKYGGCGHGATDDGRAQRGDTALHERGYDRVGGGGREILGRRAGGSAANDPWQTARDR